MTESTSLKSKETERNHNRLRVYTEDIQREAVKRYKSHIPDRFDSWMRSEDKFLFGRTIQELGEFFANPTIEEAADVLNFLAMILSKADSI